MRLYFGFSKRLNIKTIIFLFGLAFVGLVAFFGFTSSVNAWTFVNQKSNSFSDISSYFNSYHVIGYDSVNEEQVFYDCTNLNSYCVYYDSDSSNRYNRYWLYSNGLSNQPSYIRSFQFGVGGQNQTSNVDKGITNYVFFNLKNGSSSPYCTGTNENSMNLKGSFAVYIGTSLINNFGTFNKTTDTLVSTDIFYNVGDSHTGTSCSTTFIKSSSLSAGTYYYYTYICNNVMTSSDISEYRITLSNLYSDISEVLPANSSQYLLGGVSWAFSTFNQYDTQTLQYECSEDDPVVIAPDSPAEPSHVNPNTIFCNMFGDCDSSQLPPTPYIPSLNSISSVVSAPIRLLNHIYDNLDNSCSSISLPLNMSYLGSSFEKNLSLPCGDIMWSQFPESVVAIYYTLVLGLLSYRLLLDGVRFINRTLNPEDSQEYFMDL